MIFEEKIESKILTLPQLVQRVQFWRTMGDKVVFTNGCFDILHHGHIHLLAGCGNLGERVIVGLNSDASVKRLKGESRPVNAEKSRAVLLAALNLVDAVTIFEEDTPGNIITAIRPDVLVKGGDWQKADIVGAPFVEGYGGQVVTINYLEGFSTTSILTRK